MKRMTSLSLGKIREKSYKKEAFVYMFRIMQLLEDAKKTDKPIAVVCIGAPIVLADSIGPCVGSLLEEMDLPIKVLGTMQDPIQALNIQRRTFNLQEKYTVIVVDASIGGKIGSIVCEKDGIYPGSGLKKDLGFIGDYSILVTTASNRISFYTMRKSKMEFIIRKAKLIACCFKVMLEIWWNRENLENGVRDNALISFSFYIILWDFLEEKRKFCIIKLSEIDICYKRRWIFLIETSYNNKSV